MTAVLTLGETMMLLSSTGIGPLRHARELAVGIAGAESNVAIGVARLGVAARWIGRVGDDEPGRLIASSLRGEGVDTRALVDPDAPTGLMLKEFRTSTSTRVSYYRSASAGSRLRPDDLDPDLFRGVGVLHISGITPALSSSAAAAVHAAVDLAKEAGAVISFDVNFRSRLWPAQAASAALKPLARRSDILFAGDDEAPLLTEVGDDALAALAALGPTEVLLKRGARGASALIDGQRIEAPVHRVTAIDPVGAGDAFAAGYLAARCRGADPAERVEIAAATGAFAVTVRGDWEGAPSWAELEMLRAADGDVAR